MALALAGLATCDDAVDPDASTFNATGELIAEPVSPSYTPTFGAALLAFDGEVPEVTSASAEVHVYRSGGITYAVVLMAAPVSRLSFEWTYVGRPMPAVEVVEVASEFNFLHDLDEVTIRVDVTDG